ncbi:MAG: NAD(P)H-hydrate epimerase [Planctomycetes bacterium]|nr:NAD(P)H-hydrate epimerase [Planctomycetota bacterium]
MKSLTRQQVRRIDSLAVGKLGMPGALLMENAGANAARIIDGHFGPAFRSAAIVAGAGNNGGDGYVIARHLLIRGWKVAVFLVAPEDKIAGDALLNLDIIRRMGLEIRPCSDHPTIVALAGSLRSFDLVIDAIAGTGLAGPLREDIAKAVDQVMAAERSIVAVDVPTGLDCDTGRPLGPSTVRADLTVTFVARKTGFDAPGAEKYTGKVVVADIGLPENLAEKLLNMDFSA